MENWKHKVMFTNSYKTSPITMGQMPLKGLAKARNQTITNTWAMLLGIHPIVTKKTHQKQLEKLLIDLQNKMNFKGSQIPCQMVHLLKDGT